MDINIYFFLYKMQHIYFFSFRFFPYWNYRSCAPDLQLPKRISHILPIITATSGPVTPQVDLAAPACSHLFLLSPPLLLPPTPARPSGSRLACGDVILECDRRAHRQLHLQRQPRGRRRRRDEGGTQLPRGPVKGHGILRCAVSHGRHRGR